MEQDIRRIGIGNIKNPPISEPITNPVEIWTFDSDIITFDSMIHTFDEE